MAMTTLAPIFVALQSRPGVVLEVTAEEIIKSSEDVIRVLKAENANHQTWMDVAIALTATGERKLAIEMLEEWSKVQEKDATKCSPADRVGTMIMITNCYLVESMNSGDPQTQKTMKTLASASISKAEAVKFDDARVWEAKGWMQFTLGNIEAAASHFKNAAGLLVTEGKTMLKHESLLAFGDTITLLYKGEYPKAAEQLVYLIRNRAVPPGAWTALGYAVGYLGHYEDAARLMHRAVEAADPENREDVAEALQACATFHLRAAAPYMVNPKGAEEASRFGRRAFAALVEATQKCFKDGEKEDPRIWALLTEMVLFEGDATRAKVYAERAVAIIRADQAQNHDGLETNINVFQINLRADVLFQYARTLVASKQLEEAEAAYREAIRLVDDFNELSKKTQSRFAGRAGEGAISATVHPSARLGLAILLLKKNGDSDDEVRKLMEGLMEDAKKSGEEYRCSAGKRALGVAYYRLASKRMAKANDMKVRKDGKSGLTAASMTEQKKSEEMMNRALALLKEGIDEARDEAIPMFDRENCCTKDNDYLALLSYGLLLMETQAAEKPELALKYLQKAADCIGGLAKAPVGLVNNIAALQSRMDPEAAAKTMEQCKKNIQISGSAPPPTIRFNDARLVEMQGLFTEAESKFRSLIEDHPNCADAYIRIGALEQRLGKYDLAEKSFEKAIAVAEGLGMYGEPTRQDAVSNLISLHGARKNYPLLQSKLEEAANKGGDAYAQVSLIAFYLDCLPSTDENRRAKMLDAVAQRLQKLIKEHPENAYAVLQIGCYFAEMGALNEARDAFAAVIAHPMAGRSAKVNLAHALVDIAIEAIDKEVSEDGLLNVTATSSLDQAAKLYIDAIETMRREKLESFGGSTYTEFCFYLAKCFYFARNYDESLKYMQRCIRLSPMYYSSYYNMAMIMRDAADAERDQRNPTIESVQKAVQYYHRASMIFRSCRAPKTAENMSAGPSRKKVDSKQAEHEYVYCRQEEGTARRNYFNMQNEEQENEKVREERRKVVEEQKKKEQEWQALQKQREEEEQKLLAVRHAEEQEALKRANEAAMERRKAKNADDGDFSGDEKEKEKRPRKRSRSKKAKARESLSEESGEETPAEDSNAEDGHDNDQEKKSHRAKKKKIQRADQGSGGSESEDLAALFDSD